MAFNPPLLAGGLPMGIAGEVYCLSRAHMTFSLEAPGMPKLKSDGRVYLTTVRMCFVPDVSTPAFCAFDIPLQGLSEEEFKQPIFGANYLTGKVAPVPGRGLPSLATFKLTFNHGGFSTFLRLFFGVMEHYRIRDLVARRTWMDTRAQTFISESSAFVDPSDPSVLYLSQPAEAQSAGAYQCVYAPPGATVTVFPGGGSGSMGPATVVALPPAPAPAAPVYAPSGPAPMYAPARLNPGAGMVMSQASGGYPTAY